MLDRKAIKKRAKEVLSENYWLCVGTLFVSMVIACVAAFVPYVGYVAGIIVTPVIMVGLMNLYLRLYRGENVEFGDMFDGFKNYGHVLGGYWYMQLFIFLWSLLLYIPGIVKAYEYMMIPYLLADNPQMTKEQAFAESKRMMQGQKWKAFVLDLSFIGWYILSGLTLGILAVFYVSPYVNATHAALYEALCYANRAGSNGFTQQADPVNSPFRQENV